MNGKTLFTIPIYSKSFDEHSAFMLNKKREHINKLKGDNFSVEMLERQFDGSMFYPWKYSQVIGYVEINIEFNDLKAYYWWVKAKKNSYTLKDRTMEERGKLADVSKITYQNKKIRNDINEFIGSLPKLRKAFNKKYFDTTHLDMILDFIDFEKVDFNA